MYKKMISYCLCLVMILSIFNVNAFASNSEYISPNDTVVIDVPFKPGESTTVIDGDFMFVIRDSINNRARGSLFAYRYIDIYDMVQAKVWHGTICMYASGVYDGNLLALTEYRAYIEDKPSTSNLSIVSTTISDNNAGSIEVTTQSTCTGTNGSVLYGSFSIYCYGNGQWWHN